MRRLIFITSLLVLVSACATLPSNERSFEAQRLADCVLSPDCYLVHVENHRSRSDVRIYINQIYLGFVGATKSVTFPMSRAQLDGSLCGQVRVHETFGGDSFSAKDCARPGMHFAITIENTAVWFTPWQNKT